MSKDLNISRLCDAYGSLLTEHMRDIMHDYYDDDLSLAEIAENRGITRQAALYTIRQAENRLNSYESKLGLVAASDELREELRAVKDSLDGDIDGARATIDSMLSRI